MKKKQKKISDVKIFIDTQSDFYYSKSDKKIEHKNKDNLITESNNSGSIIYLDTFKQDATGIRTISFEEDKYVLEDKDNDMEEILETKFMQEEIGEETENEYNFYWKTRENPFNKNSMHIFACAIPKDYIEETFQEEAVALEYIDVITTPMIAPEILYEKEYLPNDTNDAFIYFGTNYSFISIFINGKYAYSKDFTYTLKEMYESFKITSDKIIDFDRFVKILTEKGFDVEKYLEGEEDESYIVDRLANEIFHDTFVTLNKILLSAKRLLSVETLNNIFIGTEFGHIPQITDYSKEKIPNINVSNFSFSKTLEGKELLSSNPLIELGEMIIDAEKTEIFNFTKFKRPLPFLQRPTSKPILTFLIGVLGIGLFIGSQIGYVELLKGNISKIENENQELRKVLVETEKMRTRILGEKNVLVKKETKLKTELNDKIERLSKLKIQVNSNEPITGYIVEILNVINKNKIKISEFKLLQKNFELTLITKKHLNIGKTINDILDTNKYTLIVKKVIYDDEKKEYKTKIKLKRVN